MLAVLGIKHVLKATTKVVVQLVGDGYHVSNRSGEPEEANINVGDDCTNTLQKYPKVCHFLVERVPSKPQLELLTQHANQVRGSLMDTV